MASMGRPTNVVKDIRAVIELEAQALMLAAGAVNGAHSKAVDMLLRCRGKVIVTGMGKSGLIAQKIAATLASTGTPALYLHPADAMHGDLGIIQRHDVVLALAKSGESEELNALLPALRQIGAKLIAMICNRDSTLGRAADLLIEIPIKREACPLNLAPTSSTTASLAVGDAIAVALMKLRAFKSDNFALYHPGGRLGKRLTLRVKDLMRSGDDNPVVRPDGSLSELLVQMTRTHCGAASIVDRKGRLLGLITDFDIRKALTRGPAGLDSPLPSLMNPKPTTVFSDMLAYEAAELMSSPRKPFNVLPVLDRKHRRVVGMIRLHDIRASGL